jgi:hypothetical protein
MAYHALVVAAQADPILDPDLAVIRSRARCRLAPA